MRHLLAALAVAAVAGCGADGGVLVHVSQQDGLPPIDRLHLYVGVADGDLYAGVPLPEDDIELAAPLSDAAHTIKLIADDGMSAGVPIRVTVVGYAGEQVAAGGMLDVVGIPRDYVLEYDLVLGGVDTVYETETGCAVIDGVGIVGGDDRDCDRYTPGDGDCDDHDGRVHPDAYDACEGESFDVDEDCSGTPDDGDKDGDGATCQSDCDEDDATAAPGNREDCDNGVDNDCDSEIDEGFGEVCGDGVDNDCDQEIDEMTAEICADGEDNDCDQAIDEGRVDGGGVVDPDVDGDGFSCEHDCDDDNERVFPDAEESCNAIDDDCDAGIDEAVNQDEDPALCVNDCNDENENVYPGAYDGCGPGQLGVSDDCDLAVDEGDFDMDGVTCVPDCDDMDAQQFPGNPEVCDTHPDDDCNPVTGPSPQPCLEYADANTCFYGFRACDETTGTYAEACNAEASGADTVPPRVCQDFAECAAADENRFVCGADVLHDCEQRLNGLGDPCPEASYPLDAGGAATSCTWQILGGPIQQGWTVGLVPQGGGPPVGLVATCRADFVVIDTPLSMSEGTFAVTLTVSGMVDRTEVFVIEPHAGMVCAVPSLSCITSTTP